MKTVLSLKSILLITIITISSLAFSQNEKTDLAMLSINIKDVVGNEPLALDKHYTNVKGEKFNITTFNFFISNIKLHYKNGKEYVVPQDESYFLIKTSDSLSKKINLKVPEGKYTKLSFTIGVDSLRNTMDISQRTGVLDPAGGMNKGMYWSWNSGYIFTKLEGMCDQAPLDKTGQHKFRYHIGGYSKPGINNIKTVTLDLSKNGTVQVRKNKETKLFIQADAGKFFDGPTKISIAENPMVMFGEMGPVIAKNYAEMFTYLFTEN